MKKLRIIFFGTPALSAHILEDIMQDGSHDIIGVVSNPDTTGGRGHVLIQSPVTLMAHTYSLPIFQPIKIRTDEQFLQTIRDLNPDICLVVAYGKILPQALLDIPPMGFLNVHTSLLPKYRGAAPIQHALLDGEKQTGLTVMQMSLGMDEGDILLQEIWDITPEDTTSTLWEKTGSRGGQLLLQTLTELQDGAITPRKQDAALATYTQYITKSDGHIQPDWTLDRAYHAWQAYTPWPGLSTNFGETKVTLHTVSRSTAPHTHSPLSWHIQNGLPALALSDGSLIIRSLTPAGKKTMSGEDFVRGYMTKGIPT